MKPVLSSILRRSSLWAAFVVLLVGLFLLPYPCTASDAEAAVGRTPTVSLIGSEGAAQEHWPRWRGPSGQGYVANPEAGYPIRWSGTDDALWKTPVPGRGNSSPVVWGDRIFLTTAYDDGARRSILAFRRSDGKKLWETFAPKASPEAAHPKNTRASSTVATDGERVYAYFGNHGLLAVDFDGNKVWHVPLGPFEAYHGTASSPLLYEDRVIVVQDHSGQSFIAAFDKTTGQALWRTPRRARVGWNTPIAIRVGQREEIVVSGQQEVVAYHPRTGRELWKVRGNTFEAIPTPVVGEGMVFASSGRGGPTIAIRPGGSGDVTDSHVVWKAPKGSPFVPSTVLYDGVLYMVNDMNAVATAYDAKEGEVLWQGRLGRARREGFSASPVAFAGKIFFTNDDGQTFVLATNRSEMELLHVNELGERVLASPALVDGTWYWRTQKHLLALVGQVQQEETEERPPRPAAR